jgi:photosystem II stability/assembly factor-like uncharacterized protein
VAVGGYSLLRDPADPRHVLIGGPAGLYESRDGGDTFTLRDIGGDVIVGAWAHDGSWLALAGTDAVYVSTDGGATFHATPHDPSWIPVSLALLDDGRLLLAHQEGLLVSADRGETWASAGEGVVDPGMSVVVPHPVCPERVFAASRCGGGLYRSDDSGAHWTHIRQYFHYVMGLAFDPNDATRVWAVSDDKLLRSTDGGDTWSQMYQKYHFHGFALHPDDPLVLLLGSVGSGEWADTSGRVYRSEDGGETWADSSEGIPTNQSSVHTILRWPDEPDVVLAGTYAGGDVSHRSGAGIGMYRSADGGHVWAKADLGVTDIALLAAGPGAVFAATGDGLWSSTDTGLSWTRATGPTGALLSVTFHGATGLALARAGQLWISEDGGGTWTERDTDLARNPTTALAQVGISADGAVGYATVYDAGVWRLGLSGE